MRTCVSCGTAAPEGARFCAACGEALGDRAPADERNLATVLFADLVGSTSRAEDEDPERVRVLLDRFYDAMREEIELAGGTIEKFAGDAVMAAFGAPSAQEDTPSERSTRDSPCSAGFVRTSAASSRSGSASTPARS